MEKEISNETVLKNMCPFIKNPDDECYCYRMDSQNIELTVYYCSGNFRECKIYKKLKP